MQYMIHHSAIGPTFRTGVVIILLAAVLVSGCVTGNKSEDKPVLSVSILPQKYFLEKIAGDQFNVQVMVPPGQSPDNYDLTPEQMIRLSNSRIYFMIGHLQFEKTWTRNAEREVYKTIFADSSEGIDVESEDHGQDDHQHGGVDPHIWMSVLNVKIMATNMANLLMNAYPEHSAFYSDNLALFVSELEALHEHLNGELSGLPANKFIIYHPALTYFARDYNLEQIPIELEGKEPSARYMKDIIDRAVAENIKAILVQQQSNTQEAVTIEKEINGRVIAFDPLDYKWAEQMQHIAHELKTIMK